MKTNLLEDNRSQLINKAKAGDDYSINNQNKGKNRYERRLHSQISKSVKEFNSINMDKFFKDDILDVDISVHGETKDYVVTFKVSGILENLQRELKFTQQFNFRVVSKALIKAFNNEDVYIRCSCPDWQFRMSHWALKHSYDSYDDVFNAEGRIVDAGPNQKEPPLVISKAPVITNPHDSKGPACKHVLLVLSNNTWLMKVASVITNYIKYMEKYMPDLYTTIIYPALYQKQWEPMSQYDTENEIEDTEEIPTETSTIDDSNKWAKTRTQFKPGNQSGIQFAKEPENKQINFDSIMSD